MSCWVKGAPPHGLSHDDVVDGLELVIHRQDFQENHYTVIKRVPPADISNVEQYSKYIIQLTVAIN